MIPKTAKVRLGIFIIIGAALLALFFIVVAGKSLIERLDTYYIEFENFSVSGLQVGGSVNYHGIHVGRVDKIKINPKDVTKVTLTIKIAHGTPIKEDSEAVLSLVGITGIKAVEIRGGTNESKILHPKSYIKRGSSTFDNISDKAVSIAEKVDQIAANISALTNVQNQENIAGILNDTRENLATTLQSLSVLAQNVAEMSQKLNMSIDRVNVVLNSTQIDSMVTNVNTITEQLRDAKLDVLIEELGKTTTRAGSLITNLDRALISNRANLSETLESLREASENLAEFSRQVSDQPSILLRGN